MAQGVTAEAVVVGGGPTGLASALSLHALGVDVVLLAPAYEPGRTAQDRRTTALLPSSIEMLKNLDVWDACAQRSAPLEGVRIVDARQDLLRAPEVLFKARELELPDFGANVANSELISAFYEVVLARGVKWIATSAAVKVEPGAHSIRVEYAEGGSVAARLVVGADGRNSAARAAAKIQIRSWAYDQVAIATTFAHTRPHGGVTTELHRRSGPLTTVPMPGNRSSLVWVEHPAEARHLMDLDDQAFAVELREHLQGLLGSLGDVGPRASYPLGGLSAGSMGQNRVALVGEAAHVIPPIGAQGLNLGLRDAAALAECVADARTRGQDVGNPQVLADYHSGRVRDVLARTMSVDLLNRSLLMDFLPAQALRGFGLHLLANVPALRRLAVAGGLSAAGPLPHLMQPSALA